MEVGGWLRDLGLSKYQAAFRDNGIDELVLPHLTVEDLKELGVESFLVRAKDSKGAPVMMIINPNSFTEVTMPNNAAANGQSGNNTNKSTSEKMTAPSPSTAVPAKQ